MSALNTMGLRLSQASLLLIALAVGFAPLLQSVDSGDLWIGPTDSVQLLQPFSSRLRPMGSEVRMAPEIAPLLSALRVSTRFNWSVPRGFVRLREIDRFSIRSFGKGARAFGGGHAYPSPRAPPLIRRESVFFALKYPSFHSLVWLFPLNPPYSGSAAMASLPLKPPTAWSAWPNADGQWIPMLRFEMSRAPATSPINVATLHLMQDGRAA